MEDVVGVLTPVVGGVVQFFSELLVELRLLLVAEVEEGEEEDRQEEGWEVESGDQGEEVAHMDGMWMTMSGVRQGSNLRQCECDEMCTRGMRHYVRTLSGTVCGCARYEAPRNR